MQYRETDFNFIPRLMEDEGILWYLEHSEGEHTLILADSPSVLTRSSEGGAYGNVNGMRLDDKKGEEQLWFHAEKDQLTEVEHDEDITVQAFP